MEAGIRACVFDAYGTLFDVHSAVARHSKAIGSQADALSRLWRQKQLEYTWVRALMNRHADFWQVTSDALDFAMASFDIQDPGLRSALLGAYLTLDAYAEVPEVLARLRASGIRTAILSNGSPAMLDAAVRAAKIDHLVDDTMSVETVGVYKPDGAVYKLAVDRLRLPAAQISFQSSNAWDAAGASAFGFRVVWVNRSAQPREYGGIMEAAEVDSLHRLPEIIAGG